jgi:spore coat polysaccharide biosynthesis protein SpsF
MAEGRLMKRRVLAILQARMSSRRLPGKVLADIEGAPMLLRQIERIRRARLIDDLVIATSSDSTDDLLAEALGSAGVPVFRGALDDVLGRFAAVLQERPAEHVVRLTGDCPLADPDVIDAVIAHHLVGGSEITSNTVAPTFPDGLDVEVVAGSALFLAAKEARLPFEREHVTQFIYRRPERFRILNYALFQNLSHLRWTVDEPDDLAFVRAVYRELLPRCPQFGFRDVLTLLDKNPALQAINSRLERNEGLKRSLAAEGLQS